MDTRTRLAIVGVAVVALPFSGYGQFPVLETKLTPPGAPQDSIMKTLDQVEPRIPINSETTPGGFGWPWDSTYEILSAGSYYLTENLRGEQAKIGLMIQASHVTVDLNGYSLIGSTNSQPNNAPGIVASNTLSVVIQNGSITLWQAGVLSNGTNMTVRNVRCTHNGWDGSRSGPFTRVYDCSFMNNAKNGLEVGSGSLVADVVARKNDYGIVVGSGSTVRNCVARENTNHGISLNGRGSHVSSCIGEENNIGISVDGDRCTVVNNTCTRNTSAGIMAGIVGTTLYTDCRIEGNHVAGNTGPGIQVTGTENVIVRNVSLDNGLAAYFIGASNQVGTVVSAVDAVGVFGSSGGNLDATVGPWSNFAR